ncbi:MAG TPA: hypothetical protein VG435_11295 [Acidimicrobiales bacterium]|jgi:hypothetical protein|nr:hypothetical protein [Acidimicrobiales bacterium]
MTPACRLRDEELSTEELGPGAHMAKLWAADSPATYSDRGTDPAAADFFPSVGGPRFYYSVTESTEDNYLDSESFEEAVQFEDGWHNTHATDFIVAVKGHLTLEMENGDTGVIRLGGIVQDDVRYRWRLTRDDPAAGIVFSIGASRA